MKIELNECPEILQDTVKKYLAEKFNCNAKAICVDKFDSTPFIDKSILESIFTITIQNDNYFKIYKCYDPDPAQLGVMIDSLTAYDIIDIIQNAEDGCFDHVLTLKSLK